MMKSQLKLGEILLREGIVTEDQLQKAIQIQKSEGGRVGEILIRLKLVDEKDIALALGKQLGIPYASLARGLLQPQLDQGLEQLIPEHFSRRYTLLPLSKNFNSLTVAFADPLDLIVMDNLRRMTGCEINPIVAARADILAALDTFYGKRDMLGEVIESSYATVEGEESLGVKPREREEEGSLSLDRIVQEAEDVPVVKLVDLVIKQAIEDRSSDIHIEPFENRISIRYRIDGILYEISPPSPHLLLPLVSRIKILSRLDIAEKRLPQDGGFIVRMKDRVIDIRVSVIPTVYGEKVVMRILDKTAIPIDLAQLGFEPQDLEKFRRAIQSPFGLIFLTGPTGSGKTTTLYAALNELKSPDKNIVTVEDPVEYHIDGVNQVQSRPSIGLTFANGLRAFLRQDPDIMMVGEVRDLETAQICVRASLTGHVVLSTLHTNDATGAIGRLIDIGIEPYLLVPSLKLVAAQRLVRRLCLHCREPYEPPPQSVAQLGLEEGEVIYAAKGCEKCNHSGYRGRIALFEVLLITDPLRTAIGQRLPLTEVKTVARRQGMSTLFENGMKKVKEGTTTVEETMRITLEDE